MAKFISLNDRLYDYLLAVSLREPAVLRKLREETAEHEMAGMQIAPDQGQLFALLVELLDVTKALEIGVFTGYSALSVALALPPAGKLVALEINEDYAAVARRYWAEAGVDGKIDLRLGPALASLDGLLAAGQADSFDFAFIDADKANYAAYFERCLALVRPGGLITVDNVLWNGAVADPTADSPDTRALKAFNEALADDRRVTISLLPVSDGLTLARRRGAQ